MNESPHEQRPKRKRGGQPGNRNAVRHGRRCKDVRAIRTMLREELRALRAVVAVADGHINHPPPRMWGRGRGEGVFATSTDGRRRKEFDQ